MRGRSILSLLSAAILLFMPITAMADETATEAGELAEWTFIVYLDADNNLEGAGIEDMDELELAGSTEDVNIVTLFDRIPEYDTSNGDWTGTRKFLVQHDENKGALYPYEEGINMWGSEEDEELNMGDPETLIDFATWAIDNYPAEHYFLDMWNHGGAFWGICWDDSSGGDGDCINMSELSYALNKIKLHLGRELDIVGFDACLMSQVAVMYEISDYCDIGIASAFSEPGDGWPYEDFVPDLVANPAMTPEDLARKLVDVYIDSYTDREDDPQDSFSVSMGAFLMAPFKEVARRMNELGMVLATGSQASLEATYYSQLRFVREQTKSYDLLPIGPFDLTGYCMYDLVDFLDKIDSLPSSSTVKSVSHNVGVELRAALSEATIATRANNAQFDAHCLTFYFPSGTQTQYSSAYDATVFAKEMSWDEFLHHFEAETFEENFAPCVYLDTPTQGQMVYDFNTPLESSGKAYDVQNSVIMVQIKIDDGPWNNAVGTTDWTATLPLPELEPGEHIITARSYDGSSYSAEVHRKIVVPEFENEIAAEGSDSSWAISLGLIALASVVCCGAMVWKRRRQ